MALPDEIPPLLDVPVGTMSLERFREVLEPADAAAFFDAARTGAHLFSGRTVWNVNSTAQGGGVAEMLQSLVPYARAAGVDARWVVIGGNGEFFRITKRVHNNLHGAAGDGGALDAAAREQYDAVLRVNAERLLARMSPRDVVILHDPQTAGLIPLLREHVAVCVWRCHVGVDTANDIVRRAWAFLCDDVLQADAYVFSHDTFVWEGLDRSRLTLIAPSIDPFAVKNYELPPEQVTAIVRAAGLEAGGGDASFRRLDGSEARLTRRAHLTEARPLAAGMPLVVQVSRWDHLKDPLGVLRGFVDHVAPATDGELMLAGPSVEHVTDDPEGQQVLEAVRAEWAKLPEPVRERVHLATLPMDDAEENAVMVNALQRRATVVVQKSLAEGFGLTVSEAMWKARPVVASRLGGIVDQIEDGVSGVLVRPDDLEAYGADVVRLLTSPDEAKAMGGRAQQRVRTQFLGTRHLRQYLELLSGLLP